MCIQVFREYEKEQGAKYSMEESLCSTLRNSYSIVSKIV